MRSIVYVVAALAVAAGCKPSTSDSSHAVQQSRGSADRYDPVRDLGPLFSRRAARARLRGLQDVRRRAAALGAGGDREALRDERKATGRSTCARSSSRTSRFRGRSVGDFQTDTTQTMEEHIRALWPVLTRPADRGDPRSSLIPLPNPYVVPGGRFREVYYWDSYFTMLGLIESGRTDLVKDMLDNFAYLVTTVGHIPNGNRTYYLGRSQPPYFAAMVGLYATATDTTRALRYLDALEARARVLDGRRGAARAGHGVATRRAAAGRRAAQSLLGRSPGAAPGVVSRGLRARADAAGERARSALPQLSARPRRAGGISRAAGCAIRSDLRTLETTDLVPVDLNSLLYNAERTIAALRRFAQAAGRLGRRGALRLARGARDAALLAAAYDSADGFFYDVRWRTGERVRDRPTLAAAALLLLRARDAGAGTRGRARARARLPQAGRLRHDAHRSRGSSGTRRTAGRRSSGSRSRACAATDATTSPNTRATRWLALNRRTYRATGKMTEKYDVVDLSRRAAAASIRRRMDSAGRTASRSRSATQQRAGRRCLQSTRAHESLSADRRTKRLPYGSHG